MNPIQETNQDQPMLFPEALDDYISQKNPARSIDAPQPLG